jgi:Zn-dependent M28 family amino/carboxypeptidase
MTLFEQVLNEISVARLTDHIRALEGIRHPVTAPEALARAAQYIRETLNSLGYSTNDHDFIDGGGAFSNIVATRTGTVHPDRRVLVIAHFDTVSNSPGADDNASGVAVVLELATVLKELSFEKTIHFIGVNLEENADEGIRHTGTRGSQALAQFAREQGWDIDAVLVLESVAYGWKSATQLVPPGVPMEAPEAGDFIAVVGNAGSMELVQKFGRALEQHRIGLSYIPLVVPGNGEMVPDTRRSDHAPFWDQGYQAIMLTDTTNFRNPHYHQPSDTLETLNLPFAAEVCRATGALLLELAG